MNLTVFLGLIGLQALPPYKEWKDAAATAVLEFDSESTELSIALYESVDDDTEKVGSADFEVRDGRLHVKSSSSDGFLDHWIEAVRSFA